MADPLSPDEIISSLGASINFEMIPKQNHIYVFSIQRSVLLTLFCPKDVIFTLYFTVSKIFLQIRGVPPAPLDPRL
jgi:hypothetical protein